MTPNNYAPPAVPRTRLAILRTMGPLHTEPLEYDLKSLRAIVLQLAPDLVCAEITREAWEQADLSAAPLEIQAVLAPVIALTDTVLVPVAPSPRQFTEFQASPGWRQAIANQFDRLLKWGQRVANSPEAIHGLAFEIFCHTVCALEESTWKNADREAFKLHNDALANNILQAISQDPGGRILVVVRCQWYHSLEPVLRQKGDWFEIVGYRDL